MESTIKITNADYEKLYNVIQLAKNTKTSEIKELDTLGNEIKRAEKVDPHKIAPDFITMNSEIEIIDLETKKTMTIKLVYPQDADIKQGKVSVLSPLGSALIGYKLGDSISFEVPKGKKVVKVSKILFQPEANGVFTV